MHTTVDVPGPRAALVNQNIRVPPRIRRRGRGHLHQNIRVPPRIRRRGRGQWNQNIRVPPRIRRRGRGHWKQRKRKGRAEREGRTISSNSHFAAGPPPPAAALSGPPEMGLLKRASFVARLTPRARGEIWGLHKAGWSLRDIAGWCQAAEAWRAAPRPLWTRPFGRLSSSSAAGRW